MGYKITNNTTNKQTHKQTTHKQKKKKRTHKIGRAHV